MTENSLDLKITLGTSSFVVNFRLVNKEPSRIVLGEEEENVEVLTSRSFYTFLFVTVRSPLFHPNGLLQRSLCPSDFSLLEILLSGYVSFPKVCLDVSAWVRLILKSRQTESLRGSARFRKFVRKYLRDFGKYSDDVSSWDLSFWIVIKRREFLSSSTLRETLFYRS